MIDSGALRGLDGSDGSVPVYAARKSLPGSENHRIHPVEDNPELVCGGGTQIHESASEAVPLRGAPAADGEDVMAFRE